MTPATLYEFNGRALSLPAWAREMGANTKTLRRRLEGGWSLEKVLTTPVKKREMKPDGYWEEKILNHPKVKGGEAFTLVTLAKWLRLRSEALEPHLTGLKRRELFTETVSDNGYKVYRARSSAMRILKKSWRTTDNDWLGLEPRMGVQW